VVLDPFDKEDFRVEMKYDAIVNTRSFETFVELADKIFGRSNELYSLMDEERERGRGYIDPDFFRSVYAEIRKKKEPWYW